jgi:FkbM family methyltransferase
MNRPSLTKKARLKAPVRIKPLTDKETARLNGGKIHPIQKCLGSREATVRIGVSEHDSCRSGTFLPRNQLYETIQTTTLDKFVEDTKLERVDFIKSDIEGAERDLLRGSTRVLQEFEPKLAICTYHSPEDPELLERIILEANPKYRVVHTRQKLFAAT